MNDENSTEIMLDRLADMIIDKFIIEKGLKKLTDRDKIKQSRSYEN